MKKLSALLILGAASAASGCADGVIETASGADAGAPGEIRWEGFSPGEEASNTHLWIVDRAVDLLGRHPELPAAAAAHAMMTAPACRSAWQQGLFDADYKAPYHDGRKNLAPGASEWTIFRSGATWESHFYDPDSGENYKGRTSPVARSRALDYAAAARSRFDAGDTSGACYQLGLSLHYATDLTQPMHAANFAATDWPLRLHTHVEAYAIGVQDGYARADWSGPPTGSLGALIDATAHGAKAQWPGLRGAIAGAYDDRCDDLDDYWFDDEDCWQGDPGVDAAIGAALFSAQNATARTIYRMFQP